MTTPVKRKGKTPDDRVGFKAPKLTSAPGRRPGISDEDADRLLELSDLLRMFGAGILNGDFPPRSEEGDVTVLVNFSARAGLDRLIQTLRMVALSPEEEKEAAEIMARIDRELPEEEARVERLLCAFH